MKRVLLILLSAAWLLPAARAAAPAATSAPALTAETGAVLRRLETHLGGVTNIQADFIQERELSLLNQKLVLKGTLALQQPALFAWHVREPMRYGLVITDRMAQQWDEETGKVQDMPLSANPVFQVVIEQLRSWFSGRYMSLTPMYDVRILQDHPCRLAFTPRADSPARKAIQQVVVGFGDDERYIREIRIEEISGDRTTLVFTNTVLNAPMDRRLWEAKPRER